MDRVECVIWETAPKLHKSHRSGPRSQICDKLAHVHSAFKPLLAQKNGTLRAVLVFVWIAAIPAPIPAPKLSR